MAFHMPSEETLEPAVLHRLQRQKLATLLEPVRATNAFYRRKLGDGAFDPRSDPPAALPLTTREELIRDQQAHPPWGTNLTFPAGDYCRMHQTSGTAAGAPLRVLDRAEDWDWWKKCWGIIFRAAGVQPADRLLFPFSFGPFIGFWAAFEGALALGNLCLPAGGMSTTARLRYLLDNHVTVVCCTPTYALHMAEVARREGIDLATSTVRALIVAGEPGGNVPATRSAIESAWGARVFDHAGMTEVGPYAFECAESPGSVHVMESEFIAEVIDPESGQPRSIDGAAAGAVEGELVLTSLGRPGWPLIRYRTGDRVRLVAGRCACGRHFARLEGGILGRIDDMVIIRGNNVYPSTIEDIIRSFAGVAEYAVEVDRSRPLADLRIMLEPAAGCDGEALAGQVAGAVQDRLNFRPTVRAVAPGKLPRFEMKAKRWKRAGEESAP